MRRPGYRTLDTRHRTPDTHHLDASPHSDPSCAHPCSKLEACRPSHAWVEVAQEQYRDHESPSSPHNSLHFATRITRLPQLLLDDIINVANNSVTQTVHGMEVFLTRWPENRAETAGDGWDGNQDIEQGLVAFQTLLESHTDIAFNFFELWSVRNIFAIPADLPVVAPHQKGLDLDPPPEEEQELVAEIAELRRKIDNVRLGTVSNTTYLTPILHSTLDYTLVQFTNPTCNSNALELALTTSPSFVLLNYTHSTHFQTH